jgi:hypothetical protein
MNFLQSLAVVLWIKIILFNLTPKNQMSNMWLYIFKDLINTRVIFYKGGLLYRKMAVDGSVMLVVKLIYIVSFDEYIISNEQYTLTKDINLKVLISSYKDNR